jgi:hypothetical protein
MTMKLQQMREALMVDQVARQKDGTYLARKGYFYHHGQTSEKLAERVAAALPGVTVLDHGDHFAAFRGGAPLAKSSHFWVRFTVAAS